MRPAPKPPQPLRVPTYLINAPNDPAIYHRYQRGHLVRLHQGVYVDSAIFLQLKVHERFLCVIAAKTLRCPETIFAGETALFLAGLPIFGTPQVVAVAAQEHHRLGTEKPTAAVASGAPAELVRAVAELPRIQRRLRKVERPVKSGDFWTVPIDTAVASTAAQRPLAQGLAAVDGRLRHANHLLLPADGLAEAIDRERSAPKRGRAALVASLGDPLAENGHESAGRAIMLQSGFERPELQHRFVDRLGEIFSDYFFESKDKAGEGDGFGKYLDPGLLRGRTTRQALAKEKERQARIEALCNGVIRWTRDDVAYRPHIVVERLHQAGIPSDPRWRIQLR